MDLLQLMAVAAAATAGWLLTGDGRSPAERRLAALRPEPRPTPARPPRRPGPVVRGLVACAPLCTLTLILGFPVGVLLGAGAGGAIWWRLNRADSGAVRERRARVVVGLPIAVDLLAAGVRSGSTMTDALDAVAGAVRGPLGTELNGVAERLRLGADPAAAWQELREPAELAALGRTLARAARTGAPVADVLERHSTDCRRAAGARTLALSQRLGVLVVIPLGLCFLPAFALIGVVPLAADLVSGLALP
ncbi:Flp pilus assembly protein TadB [Spinactinospora alkalitolerans]|uniref:Flp pilus assembly protein TadB n=1 Tax=Spinactinospora alkalitolerans TaxID=687207 RepID=A0A852TSF1_9ACTN|nr:type II secretion system F family protein [Spinactinospora alkalitolerans]NYE44910.1 Flp pilus assembly protein TadB [Spinactinospora alkalitolerans]